MKHATASALARLDDVLVALRRIKGLRERSVGVFYRASGAFLHFHEDGAELFADLKRGGGWERYPVTARAERERLLSRVHATIDEDARRDDVGR